MKEGFWRSTKEENSSGMDTVSSTLPTGFPFPLANEQPWEGQAEFLVKLSQAEAKAKKTRYRGLSSCRLCKKMNGCVEYTLEDWTWPGGFRHYIEVHNVRPTEVFLQFIMNQS